MHTVIPDVGPNEGTKEHCAHSHLPKMLFPVGKGSGAMQALFFGRDVSLRAAHSTHKVVLGTAATLPLLGQRPAGTKWRVDAT